MNFFKDPKYKSVRIVLLLVIIIGAGWFTISNMNQSNSNQGLVINQAPTTASKGTINTIRYYDSTLGANVKVSQSIIPGGGTSDRPGGGVTCTGSCTGNSCQIWGCDPYESIGAGGQCSSCSCGGSSCSGCTCSKSATGGGSGQD